MQSMQYFDKARRCALSALVLVGVSLGTAHATFPGETGDIVYSVSVSTSGVIKRIRPGAGTPPVVVGSGYFPAVSPDGKKIAYASGVGFFEQTQLFTMNMDGSNVVYIGPGTAPTWSPDGATLAYLDLYPAPGKQRGIYTVGLFGTPQPKFLAALSMEASVYFRMSWSPTSNLILAYAYTPNVNFIQYAIDASNGSVSTFPLPGPLQATSTPDGKSMLFSYAESGRNCIATSGFTNIDSRTPLFCDAALQSLQYYATPSPDGSAIAWYRLGGPIRSAVLPGPQQIITPEDPALVIGFDWARVPRATMTTTLAGSQWSSPSELFNSDAHYSLQTAVAVMPDNVSQYQKHLVSVNADGRLLHSGLPIGSSTWNPLTVVPGMGGDVSGIRVKRVAIAGAQDGSAQVVVVAADNDLVYHAMRYANGTWSGFNPLHGAGGAAYFAARDVAIAITGSSATSPGNAQVMANGLAEGPVYHRVRWTDGSWTQFARVGTLNYTKRLAMAGAPNGDMHMMATTDHQLGLFHQMRRADGSWDAAIVINAPADSTDVSLAIGLNDNGQQVAKVSYIAANGDVAYQRRENISQTSAWTLPVTPMPVTSNGRGVSITNTATGADLIVLQAQPQ